MVGQSREYVAVVAAQVFDEIAHVLTTAPELLESEYKNKTIRTGSRSTPRQKTLFGDALFFQHLENKSDPAATANQPDVGRFLF